MIMERILYLHKYCLPKTKSAIITSAVFFYIASFVNLMFVDDEKGFLFNSVGWLIFGLLIHFLQSRLASFLSLIFVIVGMGFDFYYFGRITGYLLVIASLAGIYGTGKFKKNW